MAHAGIGAFVFANLLKIPQLRTAVFKDLDKSNVYLLFAVFVLSLTVMWRRLVVSGYAFGLSLGIAFCPFGWYLAIGRLSSAAVLHAVV